MAVDSNRTSKKKSLRKPRKVKKAALSGVLPAAFGAIYHKVLYRPSQVMLSMPCFEEGRVPKVGMRLAMLEQTSEYRLEDISEPVFHTGVIEKVTDGGMVTLKYDRHPHAVSITFGWDSMSKYCVPLIADREEWQRRFNAKQRREYPND